MELYTCSNYAAMTVLYYILVLLFLIWVAMWIRSFRLRQKNTSAELFVEALRNENSGHFEAAVVTYQSALREVKKIELHSRLETLILEKLKVLHSAIEYEKKFFMPQGNLVSVSSNDIFKTGNGLLKETDFKRTSFEQ